MAFEDNTLLFGADPTPRIVAIELGETGTVRFIGGKRMGATARCRAISSLRLGRWRCRRSRTRNAEKLAGDLKFNWLVTTDSWKELIALRNGLKNAGRNFFALSDPVQHYLTDTGRTLVQALPFEELKRMQIEVLSLAGEAICEASRTSHREHRPFR